MPHEIGELDAAERSETVRAIKGMVLGIVRSMLAGEIGTLDGCRAVASVSRSLPDEKHDEAVRFNIVAGETDDIPFGETRQLLSQEALIEKDSDRYLRAER